MGFVLKAGGVLFLLLCVMLSACSDLEDRQNAAKEALTVSAHDNQAFRDLQTRAAVGVTQRPNDTTPSAGPTPTAQPLPTVGKNSVPGTPPFACPDPSMLAKGPGVDGVLNGARNFLISLYSGNENSARPLLSQRLQTALGQSSLFALVGTSDKYDSMQTSQAVSADQKKGCASILLMSSTYQPFNLMFYMVADENGSFKVDYVRRL